MLKRETGLMKRTTQTGPIMEQPSFVDIATVALTDGFQARGKLRIPGTLQTTLNNDQNSILILYEVEAMGYEVGNPATRLTQAELLIRKAACHLIAFENPLPAGHMVLLAHTELLVLYTDRFAIQAKFHMGPDSRVTDFIDSTQQQFLIASDVKIYPLFQPRVALITSAPLVALQKSAIRMYHKV